MEEYRSSRQEAVHWGDKQAQAFFYGLISTGALLGFGASAQPELPSVVFLLPTIILVPIALIVINLRLIGDRSGAYLRVRVPSHRLSKNASIRRFQWPGMGWYYPVYKLMVHSNLSLIAACVGITLLTPFLSGRQLGPVTWSVSSLALLAAAGVYMYLKVTDHMCKPGRLEDAWREVLQVQGQGADRS